MPEDDAGSASGEVEPPSPRRALARALGICALRGDADRYPTVGLET